MIMMVMEITTRIPMTMENGDEENAEDEDKDEHQIDSQNLKMGMKF